MLRPHDRAQGHASEGPQMTTLTRSTPILPAKPDLPFDSQKPSFPAALAGASVGANSDGHQAAPADAQSPSPQVGAILCDIELCLATGAADRVGGARGSESRHSYLIFRNYPGINLAPSDPQLPGAGCRLTLRVDCARWLPHADTRLGPISPSNLSPLGHRCDRRERSCAIAAVRLSCCSVYPPSLTPSC